MAVTLISSYGNLIDGVRKWTGLAHWRSEAGLRRNTIKKTQKVKGVYMKLNLKTDPDGDFFYEVS